ncbi:hypothetical protein D1007_38907 [Hordeum vulgare]|nr:hypothetical protein D1007_38907 [Hordeum vulgare]
MLGTWVYSSTLVECLEVGAQKAHALAEVMNRDLLGQAASDVFSHLLRLDPDFDFATILDPVPETIRAALAEWVKVHMEGLVTRFVLEGYDTSSSDDAPS